MPPTSSEEISPLETRLSYYNLTIPLEYPLDAGSESGDSSSRYSTPSIPFEPPHDASPERNGSRLSDHMSHGLIGNNNQVAGKKSLFERLPKLMTRGLPAEKTICSSSRRGKRGWRRCMFLSVFMLLLFALVPLFIFTTIRLSMLGLHPGLSALLSHWGNAGSSSAMLATWPTNFTRDIVPVAIQSHNDYWRRVPLFDAIAVGATSVEADVWLVEDQYGLKDLLVGHTNSSLTAARTLRSLYIDPLVRLLRNQNPRSEFTGITRNGIFDTAPSASMTLLIGIKTDANATWAVVQQQLQPLRDMAWLTYYDDKSGSLILGPVTVAMTGNTEFDLVTSYSSNSRRDMFFDAPLDKLARTDGENGMKAAGVVPYTTGNSLYASACFTGAIGKVRGGQLSPSQMQTLKAQIQGAKDRGLLARYWDTPSWPVATRDYVWDLLEKEGVGILSVDDLTAARKRKW